MVRIGVLDEEDAYAAKLAAYLNRYGRGKWKIAAFTDRELLRNYMEKKRLDIVAGTKERALWEIREAHKEVIILWLREEKGELKKTAFRSYSVFRYQSAKVIGENIGQVINQMGICSKPEKRIAAIYSPVNRCGKTELALQLVKSMRYGRWLYIGMEDYSFFKESKEEERADAFLFFIKERKKEKLLCLMEEGSDIIVSAFSPFDTKQLEKEDIKWVIEVLKDSSVYSGAIFDFGTGIIRDLDIFLLFDCLLVPYLPEEKSIVKKDKLKQLLQVQGLEMVIEGIKFLNMHKGEEVWEELDKIFR